MNKTLSVTALETGTVIDHIPAGQGVNIARILHLAEQQERVNVGLNISSGALGLKDLIKVKNRKLTTKEANEIAVFAPEATINIIEDFKVAKKINVQLPKTINNMLVCPNPRCISHVEPVESIFNVKKIRRMIALQCFYCEKTFPRDEIKETIT